MSELSTDDYPPLSALNDLLYCERRCALHRIENVWVDNAHTVSGTLSHQRADKPVDWKCESGREVHGLWLKSDRLRLVGKADVVEFHPVLGGRRSCGAVGEEGVIPADGSAAGGSAGASPSRWVGNEVPFPVEYKRGRRKKWDNDDVQLCAQALCLEEMLGVDVPRGAIFHIKSKRRREVLFTPALRQKTEDTAARLHELIASGKTPPPVLKPQCDGCSLRDICLPEALGSRDRVRDYVAQLFQPMALPKGTT